MRRALCLIREAVHYRRAAFLSGLAKAGLRVVAELPNPAPGDVLVIWNRYGRFAHEAKRFEAAGALVLVAENAAWGNAFAGDRWYSLARTFHNSAGQFPVGGPERWDGLGIDLAPWREDGGEVVGLPQRGIGPPGVAMPHGWIPPGCDRIRPHPGQLPCVPLERDLRGASKVVTWGSGAAIKALMLGINVESHMPNWIGEQQNDDASRLAMLRSLAWAQWRVSEIETGEPLRRLVCEF